MSQDMRFYDPAPTYTKILAGLARVGQSNPGYLQQGIVQILNKANEARDLRQRNRLVFDAVELLRGTWKADHAPDVFDVSALQTELEQIDRQSPVFQKLSDAVNDVAKTTPASFDSFQKSEDGLKVFKDDDEGLRDFDRWYRCFRSYLVLDISANGTEAEADAEFRRRINWMLDKIADPEKGGDAGLRELYEDDAWYYVRDKYFAAPRTSSAEETR